MNKVVLTVQELLYISVCLGATEVFGIEDAFYGMGESEIKVAIIKLQISLEERGYAISYFDGRFQIVENIKNTVATIAKCQKLVVINNIDIYYIKDSDIIKLQKHDESCTLLNVSDLVSDILYKWDGMSNFNIQVTSFNNEYSESRNLDLAYNKLLFHVYVEKAINAEFEYVETIKRVPISFVQATQLIKQLLQN